MIVNVANPIYDSVFKFLMEDERIAKTILSALLKKEVVDVKTRPHEYSNTTRDNLSMFRIDFAATVKEPDGDEHLILIELQKTWLNTETLRFRQYLGAQYSNKDNIKKDDKDGFAIPMVAVYLLGHRVGDIEEPVIYVNHKSYDYNGKEVTKGIPDPFVDSLVHNSIIVQIPLLRGQINNHLEKVLSVFDQTRMNGDNTQLLKIDETGYEDDADMMYILHRLTAAAADAMMRQDMNVEDEYFSAIEDRETTILSMDKQIKEKDGQLKEKDGQLKEKDGQLKEKDGQLKEKDGQLKEKDGQLKEKDGQLKEKDNLLREKDDLLKEQENRMTKMAVAMFNNGMTTDAIAGIMGVPEDCILRMLESPK